MSCLRLLSLALFLVLVMLPKRVGPPPRFPGGAPECWNHSEDPSCYTPGHPETCGDIQDKLLPRTLSLISLHWVSLCLLIFHY